MDMVEKVYRAVAMFESVKEQGVQVHLLPSVFSVSYLLCKVMDKDQDKESLLLYSLNAGRVCTCLGIKDSSAYGILVVNDIKHARSIAFTTFKQTPTLHSWEAFCP